MVGGGTSDARTISPFTAGILPLIIDTTSGNGFGGCESGTGQLPISLPAGQGNAGFLRRMPMDWNRRGNVPAFQRAGIRR